MENRIKEILAERNFGRHPHDGNYLSLEGLARKAAISAFTLSRIANGKQRCSKHIQRELAKALGRPLKDVFPPPQRKAAV